MKSLRKHTLKIKKEVCPGFLGIPVSASSYPRQRVPADEVPTPKSLPSEQPGKARGPSGLRSPSTPCVSQLLERSDSPASPKLS